VDGLGVTRLSPRFVREALVEGKLVRVLPGYASSPLKVYVLMPARKLMPASVRAFLDALEETLGVPETRRPGARVTAATRIEESAEDQNDDDGEPTVITLD
jgi:hypothetical protein